MSIAAIYPQHHFFIVEPAKLGRFKGIKSAGKVVGNLSHSEGPQIATEKSIRGHDLFFATGGWTVGWRRQYSSLNIPKILYWHNVPLTPDKVDVSRVAIAYESFEVQRSSSVSGIKVNLCRDPSYWNGWIGNKKRVLVVAQAYSTYRAKYRVRGMLISENPAINLVSKIHKLCRNRPRNVTHKEKGGSEW